MCRSRAEIDPGICQQAGGLGDGGLPVEVAPTDDHLVLRLRPGLIIVAALAAAGLNLGVRPRDCCPWHRSIALCLRLQQGQQGRRVRRGCLQVLSPDFAAHDITLSRADTCVCACGGMSSCAPGVGRKEDHNAIVEAAGQQLPTPGHRVGTDVSRQHLVMHVLRAKLLEIS